MKRRAPEVIPNGAIVFQAWPWIGCFQEVYCYWQVWFSQTPEEQARDVIRQHHPKWNEAKVAKEAAGRILPKGLQYYCHAVPYGTCPAEVWWFEQKDIVDTGLRWKVPSHDDIEMWCRRDRYSKGNGEFSKTLASSPKCPKGEEKCGWLKTGQHWMPYREEGSLVRLLDSLPRSFPRWREIVLRQGYEKRFRKITRKVQ
jgi:hypothetical protein